MRRGDSISRVMSEAVERLRRDIADILDTAFFWDNLRKEVAQRCRGFETAWTVGQRVEKGWRVESGYDRGGESIADQIEFEEKELENDYIAEQMRENIPTSELQETASRLIWITQYRKDAEIYGQPEEIHCKGCIVATDEQGGYLILSDD